MEYEKYVHHGKEVVVGSELKGKHREYCLCYACDKFGFCHIVKDVFENCVKHSIVTPIWECPHFNERD